MAHGHNCEIVNATVVGSIFTLRHEYLMFSFPCANNDAMRGVEFRHATRKVSINLRKVENVSVLMENGGVLILGFQVPSENCKIY